MIKRKEAMLQLLIIANMWSLVFSITKIHKNDYYNGDKFKCENNKIVVTKLVEKKDNYSIFKKIVNDENEIRIAKIKEKQKQKELLKLKKLAQEKKDKLLLEKQKQIAKEKAKQKKISLSRGENIDYDMTFTCSFYTGLISENSSSGNVGCRGVRLYEGVVASNCIPYGSKIKLQGYGNVTILDSGGGNFDNPNRLDIYIARNGNESDGEYYRRVQNMGIVKIRGRILK